MFGIEFGNLAFNCEVSEQTLCTITDFDNAWVIETKEMFYYIFWCTTA